MVLSLEWMVDILICKCKLYLFDHVVIYLSMFLYSTTTIRINLVLRAMGIR